MGGTVLKLPLYTTVCQTNSTLIHKFCVFVSWIQKATSCFTIDVLYLIQKLATSAEIVFFSHDLIDIYSQLQKYLNIYIKKCRKYVMGLDTKDTALK